MTSKKRLSEVWEGLFQELYANSEPPLDFKAWLEEADKKYEETGDRTMVPFDQHLIDRTLSDKIVNKWLKGLSKRERDGFLLELLNYAPMYSKQESE